MSAKRTPTVEEDSTESAEDDSETVESTILSRYSTPAIDEE